MHPILFQFGPVTIYTYGVLVATGVIARLWYARRQAPRAGLDPDKVWNLGIYGILAALVLAENLAYRQRVGLFLRAIRATFSASPRFESGGTFYGGLLGAILTIASLRAFSEDARCCGCGRLRRRIPARPRHRAPGMFRGRLLLRQADDASVGRHVHERSGRAAFPALRSARPLHPTQLYEVRRRISEFSFADLAGQAPALHGTNHRAPTSMLYGVERGTIEFFRGDPGRTMMFHDAVSLMQIVSVGADPGGLVSLVAWIRGAVADSSPAASRPADRRALELSSRRVARRTLPRPHREHLALE